MRGNPAAWSEGLKGSHRLSHAYKIKNRLLSTLGRRASLAGPLRESSKQRNPPDYSHIRLLAVYLPAYNEAACGALAVRFRIAHALHACGVSRSCHWSPKHREDAIVSLARPAYRWH